MPSPALWDLSHSCQSQLNRVSPLGLSVSPSPSLVLAPESALRLHPCRALSSAPVVRSVSATAVSCNGGEKKGLIFAAFSDMVAISPLEMPD